MKALVIHAAKDLRIEQHDYVPPAAGEVQITMACGGICGSDLHYYKQGGFGSIKLREPMILGHEVSGYISELGEGVQSLEVGQLVAISPSRPCNACRYCYEGLQNQCLNMRFYGSAMPFPHIQGAFQQVLNVEASQCAIAAGLSPAVAAMAEPLAVCLHATRLAGSLVGKKVLITGCGPIGLLSLICARRNGADFIVATDVSNFTLGIAASSGADRVINVATTDNALDEFLPEKGTFDVMYECSGSEKALIDGIEAMRPGGTILQLGLGGDMTLPMMAITAKELVLRGSFRFHSEFHTGINLLRKNLIDVTPLITHTVGIDDAIEGFELASDRGRSVKTQIAF